MLKVYVLALHVLTVSSFDKFAAGMGIRVAIKLEYCTTLPV